MAIPTSFHRSNKMVSQEFKLSLFYEIIDEFTKHRDDYLAYEAILTKWRNELLKVGSVVKSTNTNLWGIIVDSTNCPADRIAILFENKNIWLKELKEFIVINDESQWPLYIRRMKNIA